MLPKFRTSFVQPTCTGLASDPGPPYLIIIRYT